MKRPSRAGNLIRVLLLPFKGLFIVLKNLPRLFSFPFRLAAYLWESLVSLFKFSIAFKFSFYYSLMFAALLIFTSGAVLFGFRLYVTLEATRDLKGLGTFVEARLAENGTVPGRELDAVVALEALDIRLEGPSGETLYGKERAAGSLFFPFAREDEVFEPPEEEPGFPALEAVEMDLEFPEEAPRYRLFLRKDLAEQNGYLAMLFTILAVFDLVGVTAIFIAGSRTSKRMLRPLRTMTDAVKNITVNDLDAKLDVKGAKDELKELAVTFNDMTGRIKDAYDRQNQFVSDASHELRTPIAVIQGYADMLDRWGKNDPEILDESVQAIRGEARSMKDLTEKLLYLARSDRNMIQSDKTEFDMGELMEEIARETRMIDSSHQIDCEAEKPLPVLASRKSLKQALRIFIDNSRKFTPPEGRILLRAYNKKNKIVLEVEDTGIGIPKKDIPLIFNRFYRVDKSRSKKMGGSGLGLSIAKWIVDEHGGRILVKSKEGEGTRMSVVLPYR